MNVVVGLGTANVGSVAGALEFLGADFCVSDEPGVIAGARRLILPGVGAFDAGMMDIGRLGLGPAILHAVRARGAPILGVCLGMQLLLEASEEGDLPGLGLLPGDCVRLGGAGAKVPHVGFDAVRFPPAGILGLGLPDPAYLYFTHSFCLRTPPSGVLAGTCDYDGGFTASLESERIMGVQFHPEKSQATGLRVLINFLEHTAAAS